MTPEDISQEAATGKAYLHEHPDSEGRPVIVVAAAKHFPDVSAPALLGQTRHSRQSVAGS